MNCGPKRVFTEHVAGALFDQLLFHPVAGVLAQTFVFGSHHALVRQVARLDLPHPRLDLLQVLRGERRGPVEIVIEAVFDGRADAEFGLGE